MSAQPLFTVVTVTYNSSHWVKDAVESILASSFNDFEYIICDDCSTDNTWELINQYKDPRIRLHRHEKNLGEYANRNHALQMAEGKYILYVDGDDMLYQQTLRNLSEYVAAWPQAVSIWGVWSHQMQFCFFPVLLQPLETMRWIYAANLPISIMGFGETLFKTKALKAAGGFSNEFISGDTYIKKRIALDGSILLVPIGFMFWRKTEGQATNKLNKAFLGYANNVMIDRAVLAHPYFNHHDQDLQLFKHNCKVRDIKLLLRNSLLKGKPLVWLQLMKRFGFKVTDLKYAFEKADFTYLQQLEQRFYKGDTFETLTHG
ncbi:MAG: glycosyltransferase family 2 protein [Chitinophagaceae bacterium]|jgi:glycosyltransferase involved in cell wall biosynthesis